MRSAISRLLAIIAMIAGTLLPLSSAPAEVAPFTVTNAASYQPNPVASGALWAIYTHDRVSPEESWTYSSWTTAPHYGLWLEASCSAEDDFMPLPVLYVGFAYGGNQINVYKPNAMGSEPWGACPYTGPTMIRIHPAGGAAMLEGPVILLPAHPGIFTVGEAPAGDHVDGYGTHLPLSNCPVTILTDPKGCTVRNGAGPSELWIYLTGAEWFRCDPCSTNDIRFELATSPTAPDLAWTRQELRRITPAGTGVEQAMVRLLPNTAPGVYYLRVRNSFRAEYPAPLRVELGQPS